MGSFAAHYASLVVAEKPLEQQREYMEQLEEEKEEAELLEEILVDSSALPEEEKLVLEAEREALDAEISALNRER